MKYVPILRAKQGEFEALKNINNGIKKEVLPLIYFVPDTNPDRVGSYSQTIIDNIVDSWSFEENQIFLDFYYVQDNLNLIDEIINGIRDKNINFTFVLRPNNSEEFIEFVKQYINNEVIIRFNSEFLVPRIINGEVEHLSGLLNLENNQIHILFDFQYIQNHHLTNCINSFYRVYSNLNYRNQFQSLIVSGGSFPPNVADLAVDGIHLIPRTERLLFNSILESDEVNSNILIFSDYGNIHPLFEPDQQAFQGSCTIKYTSNEDFVIFRGAKSTNHPEGHNQFITKSQELVSSDYFDGEGFSWGDQRIYDKSIGREGPGNHTHWVQFTLNHHITKIYNRL